MRMDVDARMHVCTPPVCEEQRFTSGVFPKEPFILFCTCVCVCVYGIYTCLCANGWARTCVSTYGGQKLCLPYLFFPALFFDTVSHWNQGFINSTRLDNELQRSAFFKTYSGAFYTVAGASEVMLTQAPIGTKPLPCVLKQGLSLAWDTSHRWWAWLTEEPGICLFLCVTLSGFLLSGFWVLNCKHFTG